MKKVLLLIIFAALCSTVYSDVSFRKSHEVSITIVPEILPKLGSEKYDKALEEVKRHYKKLLTDKQLTNVVIKKHKRAVYIEYNSVDNMSEKEIVLMLSPNLQFMSVDEKLMIKIDRKYLNKQGEIDYSHVLKNESNKNSSVSFKRDELLKVLKADRIELDCCDEHASFLYPTYKSYDKFVILKNKVHLNRNQIEKVEVVSGSYKNKELSLIFNQEGTKKLFKLTKSHINKRIAIVLNGQILLSPVVMEPIEKGRVRISGNYTTKELLSLADAINGSKTSLPFNVTIEIIKNK